MKNITFNGKIIKVYDSIDEMPVVNFQKYNKYLLIDSGIGSDTDDIDAHIVKIARYIKSSDSKKALAELQNMRQNMYMVANSISPKYLAFAALIHSVDGKEIKDLSDEGLKETLAALKQVKHSSIIDFLNWLKKKVSEELEIYFPKEFTSVKEKEVYDILKRRVLLILDGISNNSDNSDKVEAIDLELLGSYKPACFIGSDSAEVKYDKQFESACVLIAQKTSMDAKKMTVLQFYNALENIKKQADLESKSFKNSFHKK